MESEKKIEAKDEKRLFSWEMLPICLTTILTFISPLFFLADSISDLNSTKALLILIFIYLILFVWGVLKFKELKVKIPFNLLSLSIFLIPVIYIFSGIFSENMKVSFWGRDFGIDTVFVLSSFFAFFLLGNFIFQNVDKVKRIYIAFTLSAIIAFLFHILNITFNNFIPSFDFFFESSSNTIGKWFDLGAFAGLGLIFSTIHIRFIKDNLSKLFSIILFILSIIILTIVNFSELWIVLGLISLVFLIYSLSVDRIKKDTNLKTPTFSLVILIFSIIFIIAGNQIAPTIQNFFDINFVEARPNIILTGQILIESIKENPLLGVGPSRFVNAWNDYKSIDVNLSNLWNVDFNYGYGFIPSLFVSSGILGILSWLFFFGLFIYFGFISLFKKFENEKSQFIIISSFVSAFYLWIMNIIFIPSYVTLFLTFLFSAIFIASLYRENLLKTKEIDVSNNAKISFIYIFKIVALLIVLITAGYYVIEKFVSIVYLKQSLTSLNQGEIEKAEEKIIASINLNQNDSKYRILSQIYQIKIGQAINNQNLTETERANNFQISLSNAVSSLQAAITYDDQNYLNHLELGKIFSSIIQFGVDGASEEAKNILEKAREINPKNPNIVLELARVQALNGNNEEAKKLISESLELKQNYTEAVFLLAQIQVSEGEIENAIANIQKAVLVEPNNPTAYFQLGLLFYQNEQFNEAVNAFENAVISDSFYANAKYFLGLSYDRVDRKNDAILQFEDLLVLNPENSEIKFILENLKNDNPPFFGAEQINPPVDDSPENREELPIEDENLTEI